MKSKRVCARSFLIAKPAGTAAVAVAGMVIPKGFLSLPANATMENLLYLVVNR